MTEGRKKTIELSFTGLTIVLVVLTILTYIIDQQKSNWICGAVLFIMEIFALGIQSILTVAIWKTTNKKTKFILLALSILIIGLAAYGFVDFNLNCS